MRRWIERIEQFLLGGSGRGPQGAEPIPLEGKRPRWEESPPSKGAWLEATTREGKKLFFPLQGTTLLIIGTAPECDLVLDDRFPGHKQVAPRHAKMELWQGRWVIIPLSHETPIFVNGKRTGENALRDGMDLTVGEGGVTLAFHVKPNS